jgi:hypothetical protein
MKKKFRAFLLLPFVALLVPPTAAAAWNNTGHMAVALIAYRELRPATRARLLELLKSHPAADTWKAPEGISGLEAEAFVVLKAATWPDFIRDPANPGHEDHRSEDHYVNLPVPVPKEFPVPAKASREAALAGPGILRRLNSCVKTIRDPKAAPVERAKELSWLLHLVGDVHQPLHCAAQFSAKFPDGDRGGNDVIVAPETGVVLSRPEGDVKSPVPTLHACWDRILGTAEDVSAVHEVAYRCLRTTRADLRGMLKMTEFNAWVEEGANLAADFAYGKAFEFYSTTEASNLLVAKGTLSVPALPPEYVRSARDVAERRVALAGYRLADLLEAILKD